MLAWRHFMHVRTAVCSFGTHQVQLQPCVGLLVEVLWTIIKTLRARFRKRTRSTYAFPRPLLEIMEAAGFAFGIISTIDVCIR